MKIQERCEKFPVDGYRSGFLAMYPPQVPVLTNSKLKSLQFEIENKKTQQLFQTLALIHLTVSEKMSFPDCTFGDWLNLQRFGNEMKHGIENKFDLSINR